mmetsp:Transcript_17955/g.52059  ORF Transcript_17955/g.52059 Transcript_17955/m.52059 type:complete len:274 (-) Transcript_17955:210-1031(-)
MPTTRNDMGALLAVFLAAAAPHASRAFVFGGGPRHGGEAPSPAPRARAPLIRPSTTTAPTQRQRRDRSPSARAAAAAANAGPVEEGDDAPRASEIVGLTDDGDFALFGINAVDPTTITSTTRGGDGDSASSPPGLSFLLGMDRGDGEGSSVTAMTPLSVPPAASAPTAGDQFLWETAGRPVETQKSEWEGERGHASSASSSVHVDPEDVAWLEDWIADAMPTLKPSDAREYARGLARIGFDPECVTRSELRMDDLSFMKVLHRRYLYEKVLSL